MSDQDKQKADLAHIVGTMHFFANSGNTVTLADMFSTALHDGIANRSQFAAARAGKRPGIKK